MVNFFTVDHVFVQICSAESCKSKQTNGRRSLVLQWLFINWYNPTYLGWFLLCGHRHSSMMDKYMMTPNLWKEFRSVPACPRRLHKHNGRWCDKTMWSTNSTQKYFKLFCCFRHARLIIFRHYINWGSTRQERVDINIKCRFCPFWSILGHFLDFPGKNAAGYCKYWEETLPIPVLLIFRASNRSSEQNISWREGYSFNRSHFILI